MMNLPGFKLEMLALFFVERTDVKSSFFKFNVSLFAVVLYFILILETLLIINNISSRYLISLVLLELTLILLKFRCRVFIVLKI